MWIMDPRKTGDVGNGSQKNRRCGLRKQEGMMYFMKTANMDDANSGSHKAVRF